MFTLGMPTMSYLLMTCSTIIYEAGLMWLQTPLYLFDFRANLSKTLSALSLRVAASGSGTTTLFLSSFSTTGSIISGRVFNDSFLYVSKLQTHISIQRSFERSTEHPKTSPNSHTISFFSFSSHFISLEAKVKIRTKNWRNVLETLQSNV